MHYIENQSVVYRTAMALFKLNKHRFLSRTKLAWDYLSETDCETLQKTTVEFLNFFPRIKFHPINTITHTG
jgi:hypothetical protein